MPRGLSASLAAYDMTDEAAVGAAIGAMDMLANDAGIRCRRMFQDFTDAE